ncbi:DUF2818 family protein [Ideonella oryzae]|uniref:DUF2818 family protein n=1 Tax=Ideonella oryzae TaxID=2937441 RepID=A0ABT1BSB0_9BURK|nr:DUF2818 family protein [Ideonella oryzae]MCO5979073.1 DUF2818 family protein [Ideonella oryzae]
MTQDVAVWMVLVAALLAANLPFLSQRVLLVGPRQQDKAFGWRLLELVLLWLAVLAAGFGLENQLGQRSPQGWEFFAALGCLFLTLAVPGFIWRYLRRRRVAEVPDAG